MAAIISITGIGIIFFFKLFYVNFLFGEAIYLFSFELSSVELVLCFYIFLNINLFFIFNKNRNLFLDKERIVKFFILHLLTTSCLVIIGAYTFSIGLQFVFLLSLFKSRIIFAFIYLLCIHYSLLLLFGSSSFILYFLLLIASMTFIFKETVFLKKDEVIVYMAVSLALSLLYINTVKFIYEVYIWLDVVDDTNYLIIDVIFILTFLHGGILVSTIIKKKNNVFFKKY